MLEIEAVSKRFGAAEALHAVSLTVERGQTGVLIGESGSGKSTVLRLITGLLFPDAGKLRFDGVEITAKSLSALRLRIGYVIQEGGLFPHLTAYGNAALLAKHLGWDKARIAARIEELSALMRLPAEAMQRYPHTLSGGQRQRVGLMRALMLDPELLLLDEPLGALDPITRAELQTDLRAIFNQLQKTVLIVTHDLAEAAFFGDFIAIMRSGQILQRGTLRQLMDEPADPFITRFIHAQHSPLVAEGGT
ncbi:MAG TPA: ATP-binding cassette domain-containing protein [Polyangiales bacterium]|nr:ATP-binding cassette domain-containing protein [Polyangiales bacterium]